MLLFLVGVVSYDRISEIYKNLTGNSISKGTIHEFITRSKKQMKDTIEYITDMLIGSELNHYDETGMRVNGRLWWLHVAANEKGVLLSIQKKRGEEGMRNAGVLGEFDGIGMTDCWSPYFNFKNMINALCNAHLIRELENRWENTKQQWTQNLTTLLLCMNAEKHQLLDQGINAFSPEQLEHFSNRYDEIIAAGIELNPIPERPPGAKGRIKKGIVK
jgi:transposase